MTKLGRALERVSDSDLKEIKDSILKISYVNSGIYEKGYMKFTLDGPLDSISTKKLKTRLDEIIDTYTKFGDLEVKELKLSSYEVELFYK